MSSKKERDIVLFLGAGFSREADLPTMAGFDRASKEEIKNIRERHKNKSPRLGYEIFSNAYREFKNFQKFCEQAHKFVTIDSNNMETIFCMAEIMLQSNSAEMSNRKFDQIKRWLWKIYHRCPPAESSREVLAGPYLELIDILKTFDLGSKLNVITTNYDLLFEYIAWKKNLMCAYPFENENLEKLRFLEYDIPYILIRENEVAPIICKLHGSINFFESKKKFYISDNSVPPNNNLKIGESLIKGMPEIFAFDALYSLMKSGEPSAPSIVPPTYAKLEGKPWLHEMWNGALRSIQNANHIIFIGYSMPQTDGFIHALIQSAMALREYNPPPKVFVIDPAPSKEYQRLFRGKVKSYKSCFGQAVRNGLLEKIFKECSESTV